MAEREQQQSTSQSPLLDAVLPHGQLVAPNVPLLPSLGPQLQLHGDFLDLNAKWLDYALRSGNNEDTFLALNIATLLSFHERYNTTRGGALLLKVPFLLECILPLVLKLNVEVPSVPSSTSDPQNNIFNENEELQASKSQIAVSSSNIIRNLSFSVENASVMTSNENFLDVLLLVLRNYETEDDELVTNMVDVLSNLSTSLDLDKWLNGSGSQTKQFRHIILKLLDSPQKAWHHGILECLAKIASNSSNEFFLQEIGPEIFEKLSDFLGESDYEIQSAAILAVAAFAELGPTSRVQLGQEKWMISRLLSILKAPHPVADICRRVGSILECLAIEDRSRERLLSYEAVLVELAFTENKCSEQLSRVLLELSREEPSQRSAKTIWMA